MSDPLLRELDHYVVLDPRARGGTAGERILTAADTLRWLAAQLAAMAQLPADLLDLPTPQAQAERLLETACELELEPGLVLQWYAVRLEPPSR